MKYLNSGSFKGHGKLVFLSKTVSSLWLCSRNFFGGKRKSTVPLLSHKILEGCKSLGEGVTASGGAFLTHL